MTVKTTVYENGNFVTRTLTDEELVTVYEYCVLNHGKCQNCLLWNETTCGVTNGTIVKTARKLMNDNKKKDKYIAYLKRKLDKTGITYRSKL